MTRSLLLAPFIALALAAAPLAAQERGKGGDTVPSGFRPPPGMCRIWLDNVPAGQQPAPTDCATAVRNRPPNGRVLFGDEPRGNGRGAPKPKKLRPGSGEWQKGGRIGGRDSLVDQVGSLERGRPAPVRGQDVSSASHPRRPAGLILPRL